MVVSEQRAVMSATLPDAGDSLALGMTPTVRERRPHSPEEGAASRVRDGSRRGEAMSASVCGGTRPALPRRGAQHP